MASRRGFGQIKPVPSTRYRARYTGPDTTLDNTPSTFRLKGDTETWLSDERTLISAGSWTRYEEQAEMARAAEPRYADAANAFDVINDRVQPAVEQWEQLNPQTKKGKVAQRQLEIHEQYQLRAAAIRESVPDGGGDIGG